MSLITSSFAGAWDWSEPHRLRLVSRNAVGDIYMAGTNVQARYIALGTKVDVLCQRVSETKKAEVIECTVERVVLEGVPHDNDDGRLVTVLAEYQTFLTGQVVELQIEPNGRNRRFDVPTLRDARSQNADLAWHAEYILRQVFTPMVPQGPAADEEAWKQKAYNTGLRLGWGMAPIEWTRTEQVAEGYGKSNLDETKATVVWDERGVVQTDMVSHYVHQNFEAWFESELRRLGPDDAPLEPLAVEREALYR